MKPNRIQRNIQSTQRGASNDGPRIGRVVRMRDHDEGRSVRRSGVRKASSFARHKLMWVWSCVFAAAALMVIVGFTLFWVKSRQGIRADEATEQGLENVRVASAFASPSEDEAIDLVKRAMAVRDPAIVETYMRPGRAAAEEVVAFMAGMEERDGKVNQVSWLSSMDMGEMLMDGVLVVCGEGPTMVERIAFLVPDERGEWKMDYEGFARTSTPSWQELLEGRAEQAEVRVLVVKDSYYNGPFLDEERWEGFALSSPESKKWIPDGMEVLRGYCRKGSPQAQAMDVAFGDEAKMKRLTMEIRRKAGADSRQFEITRVLSEDWVIPDVPFDEKFK